MSSSQSIGINLDVGDAILTDDRTLGDEESEFILLSIRQLRELHSENLRLHDVT